MASITAIEGIGPAKQKKLRSCGVRTTDALLAAGGTKKGRRDLAQESGLPEDNILTWVNHADLMRIKGVSSQYSELLEAAGVDTVKELRRRNPENLAAAMQEANEAGRNRLCKRPPSARVVTKWVEQAKALDPAVSH